MGIDTTITELTSWQAAVTESENILRDNTRGRDNYIRQAVKDGLRIPIVMEATGLSRQRIYQVRDAK